MKQGKTYYRTSDLREYQVVGEEYVTPLGMTYTHSFHVLHDVADAKNVARIFDGINMDTTRDWATTHKMAIANKIKLLENEIVMLTQML